MNSVKFTVNIRLNTRVSAVKAYADVFLTWPDGTLTLNGFSVIQKDNKLPFIAFPSRKGNNPGKYFAVVEAEGSLRKSICEAVLSAYEEGEAQQ